MNKETKIDKIGILTFHKSINYGSSLQAVALYNVLKNNNYNVELIDYEPLIYKKIYGFLYVPSNIKEFCIMLSKFLLFIPLVIQKQNFIKFNSRYSKTSQEKYYFGDENTDKLRKYNTIIVGGDQVWNLRVADADPIFFLPKKSNYKKITYSVSINNTNFTEDRYKDKLKEWINDFSYISIRENSGLKKINNYLKINKVQNTDLDSTFLLNKDFYYRIMTPNRIIKKDYIFVYCISYYDDTYKAATYISNKLNIPVYTILSTRNIYTLARIKRNGTKIIKYKTSPSDFLNIINNASFVLTNSFHGLAFSIIFEKQFFAIKNYKNNQSIADERVHNIIEQFGLNDRYKSAEEIKNLPAFDFIDYSKINSKIEKFSNESLDRLLNELK